MNRCLACDKILDDLDLKLDDENEFCAKCYLAYLDSLED